MVKTRLIASAALLIFSAACSQSPSQSAASVTGPTEIVLPLNFGTHMHGKHERPNPRDTEATGQLNLRLSDDGESLEYKLIAANIDNVVASHIHQGTVDQAGPAVVFLFGPAPANGGRHNGVLAEGTIRSENLINGLKGQPISALIAMIQRGEAYANIHTDDGVLPSNSGPGDFAAGEIRGQVRK